MNDKLKRPRIAIGILVGSTNPKKVQCIKGDNAITIAHYYRPDTFRRVGRHVIH